MRAFWLTPNAHRFTPHSSPEIKVAGLIGTLDGKGEYTVFAPTDQAYAAAGKPKDKSAAAKDAGYLIVKGRYDSQGLLKIINENAGQAKLRTLEGGTITASQNGPDEHFR